MSNKILWVLLTISLCYLSWQVAPNEKVITQEVVKEVQVESPQVKWIDNPKNPKNICIAQGGIPKSDAWTGELRECIFAPTNN